MDEHSIEKETALVVGYSGISAAVVAYYKAARARGNTAQQSIREARIRAKWNSLNGSIVGDELVLEDEPSWEGHVRLRITPDESPYDDDSFIDTWDDEIITVDGTEMNNEQYRAWLWDRIERDGVWGVIGEYWDGAKWQHADSYWSFIGDDWKNSGYDIDIMDATMDKLEELQEVFKLVNKNAPRHFPQIFDRSRTNVQNDIV